MTPGDSLRTSARPAGFLGSRLLAVIVSLVMVAIIALADYLTHEMMNFTALYLVPIGFLTWRAGRLAGLSLSLLSVLAWGLTDYRPEHGWFNSYLPWWNVAMRLGIFLVACCVLTKLKRALDVERELARTDSVTGAANARSFMEVLKRELERSRRNGQPFTLAYLDLDNFKDINDRLGHDAGDGVLRAVAGAVARDLRATDLVARLGGDEFAVLLPETGEAAADEVLGRMRERVSTIMSGDGRTVTLSLGAVTFWRMPGSADEALRLADEVMYAVKRAGKNAVRRETQGA